MLTIDEKVLSDVGKGFSVPAQPGILLEIQQMIAQSEPDLNKIAETITQDVALSASILKTINSPIYGLARSVSDIKKSVRYIGLQGIVTLVTSSLLQRSFSQEDCAIALDDFWHNATNIANTCVRISQQRNYRLSVDKLFSLGLFHDCGIPVMAMRYTDYEEYYQLAINTPSIPITTIEEQQYKVNHATLGYYVASSWRLPREICNIILVHHERDYLLVENDVVNKKYYAVLKLAENLVYRHKWFRDSPDWAFIADLVLTTLELDDYQYQDLIEDLDEL